MLLTQHGRRRRFYTPEEVKAHNSADDAWFSLFDKVLDLTKLIAKNTALATPLIDCAGSDISHWFNSKSWTVKSYYSQVKKVALPYIPMGRFIHVPPSEPSSKWCTSDSNGLEEIPWWSDTQYIIGNISRNVRKLRVVNTLTQQSDVFEVCGEETIKEIQTRYTEYNTHAQSYTWKYLKDRTFVPIEMSKTLEQLGIVDESKVFEHAGINQDQYMPVVHIYFNDDLTDD